jgi:DNA-binding NarL/FixJ family response regulator
VRLAEQAVKTIPESSLWWATVARINLAIALLMNGDPQRSLEVMTDAGGGSALPLIQPSRRPSCLDIVTAAAFQAGDITTAKESAQRADAESRKLGLAGQRGFALRSQGIVLSAAGRHAAAVAAFSKAKDLHASVGMGAAESMTLILGAQSAAAAGDAKTALSMASRANALAKAMGSLKIQTMAEDVRQRLASETNRHPAHHPLAPLTTREREIARLAATGRTSRDIAEHLCLSPRTVETHLARVYRKLGLSSRAALANLLAADRHTTAKPIGGTESAWIAGGTL